VKEANLFLKSKDLSDIES